MLVLTRVATIVALASTIRLFIHGDRKRQPASVVLLVIRKLRVGSNQMSRFMRLVHFLLKPSNAIEYGLMKARIWICPCPNCKAGIDS